MISPAESTPDRNAVERGPIHCTRGTQNGGVRTMNGVGTNPVEEISGYNAVARVPTRSTPAWPPPWLVKTEPAKNGNPLVAPSPDPSERWGPSLDHSEPPIDIPADHWRWRAATLPHAEWLSWRARSGEIQAAF